MCETDSNPALHDDAGRRREPEGRVETCQIHLRLLRLRHRWQPRLIGEI